MAHFPKATAADPTDLLKIEEWYSAGKELDAKGQFEKAKGYYNGCMSLILSKRVKINGVG